MSTFPETRISLILRLAVADDAVAWREFARLYAPAVLAMAKRRGLQPADAEDFVQELLLAVARAAGRWQPDPGRAQFRTWLYRVASNLLADHFRHRAKLMRVGVNEPLEDEVVDPGSDIQLTTEFDLEYRRAMFHRAAEVVRERVSEATWLAFWATAVDNVPTAAVSRQLGLSVGSVYVARSRTMKLLREEIVRLEELNLTDKILATGKEVDHETDAS